jgi:hypothetical protein
MTAQSKGYGFVGGMLDQRIGAIGSEQSSLGNVRRTNLPGEDNNTDATTTATKFQVSK